LNSEGMSHRVSEKQKIDDGEDEGKGINVFII
jgi:hypothetical protein